MASESPASAGPPVGSPIDWQDVRFVPAIEAVRKECGVTNTDDDAFIAMLLDRCNWDKAKVKQLYARSVARRKELGLAEIREHIIRDKLAVEAPPPCHGGATPTREPASRGRPGGLSACILRALRSARGSRAHPRHAARRTSRTTMPCAR
tara:strand:+ start:271 stop:720 length:450 start_codon:yes stop_codon:yes gene_type:complete